MKAGVAGAAIALWFASVLGAYLYGGHESDEEWEQREAVASANQEKRNAATIATFHESISALGGYYSERPPVVRVRYQTALPSECPEPPAPDPKDIVLIVGGVKRGDRGAAAR